MDFVQTWLTLSPRDQFDEILKVRLRFCALAVIFMRYFSIATSSA